jgi:hypothetical protein
MEIDNTVKVDVEKLTEDAKAYVSNMASAIYNKEVQELDTSEMATVIIMDVETWITEYTVSSGATRQTEVKYNSNNYHFSTKITCGGIADIVKNRLNACQDVNEMLNRYIKYKTAFNNLIQTKMLNAEQFLRELSFHAESKDGIQGVGRFKND